MKKFIKGLVKLPLIILGVFTKKCVQIASFSTFKILKEVAVMFTFLVSVVSFGNFLGGKLK